MVYLKKYNWIIFSLMNHESEMDWSMFFCTNRLCDRRWWIVQFPCRRATVFSSLSLTANFSKFPWTCPPSYASLKKFMPRRHSPSIKKWTFSSVKSTFSRTLARTLKSEKRLCWSNDQCFLWRSRIFWFRFFLFRVQAAHQQFHELTGGQMPRGRKRTFGEDEDEAMEPSSPVKRSPYDHPPPNTTLLSGPPPFISQYGAPPPIGMIPPTTNPWPGSHTAPPPTVSRGKNLVS